MAKELARWRQEALDCAARYRSRNPIIPPSVAQNPSPKVAAEIAEGRKMVARASRIQLIEDWIGCGAVVPVMADDSNVPSPSFMVHGARVTETGDVYPSELLIANLLLAIECGKGETNG